MPARRLRLTEFSAFQSADIEFVDGLNVFVGANGTGKTHVLKVIYSLLEAARTDTAVAEKLAGVFRPDDGQVGRLARRVQGLNTAKVILNSDGSGQTSFELHTKGNLKHSIRGWRDRQR